MEYFEYPYTIRTVCDQIGPYPPFLKWQSVKKQEVSIFGIENSSILVFGEKGKFLPAI